MSKLDDILDDLFVASTGERDSTTVLIALDKAGNDIKALMLELIGEVEDINFDGDDGVIASLNSYKADLRKEVEEL